MSKKLKRNIISGVGIIAAVAFLASCSVVEITTGTWYHLSSDEDSGYAIFNKQGDKDLSCVYYRDGGTLTAQRTTAVAKERRKTVRLTFPDGTRRNYTVERHNVPAYIPVNGSYLLLFTKNNMDKPCSTEC